MSDLISKSKTIDLLYQVFEKHSMATDKNDPLCGFGAELFKNIKAMPTAYDINKVVEELNKAKDEIANENYCRSINEKEKCDGRNCFKCCAEYLIEIVKLGGVFDDVCEWKSASDGEFIQNPHTKRLYSNEPSMQNVYCNTCGKKIKVVGD